MLISSALLSAKRTIKMQVVDIDEYSQEKDCYYRGEQYTVRDNGAVFRHQPKGKRKRANDSHWTFGKENSSNPYLHISGVPVHRIVATAFHGGPAIAKYVVDHIDSNCRNNRPENLRWLTRLENALKNPATRRKIEHLCGSIEAFLENPSILNELRSEPNFKWMRTVTPEEAQNCMVRMSTWARTPGTSTRPAASPARKSLFEERVYKPIQKWEVGLQGEPGLELAETPWCAQYMWGASVRFPCCLRAPGEEPLEDYFRNLRPGAVFAQSEIEGTLLEFKVRYSELLKPKVSILVLCEREDATWLIVGIEFHGESRHFIHFILGSYSGQDDAFGALIAKRKLDHFWLDGYANANSAWYP